MSFRICLDGGMILLTPTIEKMIFLSSGCAILVVSYQLFSYQLMFLGLISVVIIFLCRKNTGFSLFTFCRFP